jgi:hypothetical protein
VLVPFAVRLVGLATRLEFVAFGAPATKVTVVVSLIAPIVAVIVLLCATVELRVAVKIPDALVLPLAGVNVLLEPVLPKLTAWPLIKLFCASLTVTVIVVVLEPSAVTVVGLADTDELTLLGAPATKLTVVVSVNPPIVAVTVLLWATVELNVAVNTPEALVVPLAGVNVLFEPLLAKLTA